MRGVDQRGVVSAAGCGEQNFSGIKRTLSASCAEVGICHITNSIR
jgi:hypothetical protein